MPGIAEAPKVLLSPRVPFDQGAGASWRRGRAVLVCGRFEGVDERVIEAHALEEIRSAISCFRAARSRPWR